MPTRAVVWGEEAPAAIGAALSAAGLALAMVAAIGFGPGPAPAMIPAAPASAPALTAPTSAPALTAPVSAPALAAPVSAPALTAPASAGVAVESAAATPAAPAPRPDPVAATPNPAPAPHPVPAAAPVAAATADGCVVLDVRYAPNDLKPAPADRQAVDATRQWLEAHANARATVRAFTDAQGDAAHNLALSHARGRWISQHLTGHGVVQSRIHLQAFGEYAPRMDVSPGDKANRRVEVWVSGAPCPGSFQENRP